MSEVAVLERPAGIGHNNPPDPVEIFAQNMKEKHSACLNRADELLAKVDEKDEAGDPVLPTKVDDDEASGKLGDFLNQIQKAIKAVETAREAEKAEYLEAGKRVDGFFKVRYVNKLTDLKKQLQKVNDDYLKAKADEERRKAEEEAERLRAEAAEKLRLAQEAEAEANRKRQEAEDNARKAKEEADAREKKIREDAEAERQAQAAKIAALEKEKEDLQKAAKDKADKDAAEAAKTKLAEVKTALTESKEELKAVDQQEREGLKEVKADVREAETAAAVLTKEAKADTRESKKLLDEASRTDKTAEKMEKLADSSLANLARTRGEQGSVSTLQTKWIGEVVDRNKVSKEKLWPHLQDADIQIALNRFVAANPGELMDGAYIREESSGVTR